MKFLIISFVIALITPTFVSAATTFDVQAQIQAMISSLQQQLVQLQAQLAQLQGVGSSTGAAVSSDKTPPISQPLTTLTSVPAAFSNDSVYPLNISKPIYALSINADIKLKSDKSLVRVILVDANKAEYLVYEAYPLIVNSNSFSVDNICEESCVLNSIIPSSLKIQLADATINIKSVAFSDSPEKLSTDVRTQGAAAYAVKLKKSQTDSKIQQINAMIKNKGLGWIAGETSISRLSYSEKKKLFTNPDKTPADKLPNLQGFEYYKGGVFKILSSSQNNTAITNSTNIPKQWDWRNVSGENWMTPIKNQGSAGTCWAHSSIGALEVQINLYYNQHLDVNLSEQMLVDCVLADFPGYPSSFNQCLSPKFGYIENYCKTQNFGIPDEKCDLYAQRDNSWNPSNQPYCSVNSAVCSDWSNRVWKNNGYINYELSVRTEDNGLLNKIKDVSISQLKQFIIKNGPINEGILSWNHAMVLEGYETDSLDGETIWIFKNSWGADWGESGYVKVKTSFEDLLNPDQPTGPFTPPLDKGYWPAGFDGSVKCVDKDSDGYCSWGTSEQKPSTCPTLCKPQKDCDDSNPNLGQFDANFNCVKINSNNPPVSVCAYSLSSQSQTFTQDAGSGSVNVSVTSGTSCSWTASTNSASWDWIGIRSGLSGTSNGTVNYFILANNTTSTRTGTLTIAGQTFTITQLSQSNPSVSCTASFSPSSVRYCDGTWVMSGTSNPTTGLKIKWYGTKNGVQDENGSDYGQTTNFSLSDGPWPNNSAVGNYTRYFKGVDSSGNVVCTSNVVNVSIADCGNTTPIPSVSISPLSQTFSKDAGSSSVSVSAPDNYSWTASTNSGSWDWIGISSGQSGAGNGVVNYFILANNSGSTRTGTLIIAGQTFTITQTATASAMIENNYDLMANVLQSIKLTINELMNLIK